MLSCDSSCSYFAQKIWFDISCNSQEIGFNNYMLHELSRPIVWKNEAIYLLLNLNRER